MRIKKYIFLILLLCCCKEKEEKITVPELTGKTVEEVKKSYPYIKLSINSYEQDPKYPKDVIYSQSPPAGSVISKKEFVSIDVSQGWFPPGKALKFDGEIQSIELTEQGVNLTLVGYVRNPNPAPVYLNYFYFTPYDNIGRRYKTKKINVDVWLPPNSTVSKSYQYFIPYEKLVPAGIKIDSLIVKILVGCVYETSTGTQSTQKELGPKTIIGLLKNKMGGQR